MNLTIQSDTYARLYELMDELYHQEENKRKSLSRAWHHIKFVHDKFIEFANELDADVATVASAALVHDLNYIFTDKIEPDAAKQQTREYLVKAGFDDDKVEEILLTIENAHLGYRGERELANESKALADADTLFKALPVSPILFASKFISDTGYDIRKLATQIVAEQEPLILRDEYFYTQLAKDRYSKWAVTTIEMWKSVVECLDDESVQEMLQIADELGVL